MSDDLLDKNGVYLFAEDVNAETCASAMKFILSKNLMPVNERPKDIKLIINSPGGSVVSCFALLDIMGGSKIPITTYGLGMIASCGLLLFMGGHKRILSPNTSVLSHQYAWGSGGKEHELIADRVEQDNTGDRIREHYKRCTGLSEKVIEKELLGPSDVWLTAKQAKKYNLCDQIKDFRL